MTGITNISRDWGVSPCIVRITTTDNLAAITTTGYITAQESNIELINNGAFEWAATDYVLISYSNGIGFFTADLTTNFTFVAGAVVPGSLSNTLASADIFVGSGANVATGVAMSGDVHIDNTGATTLQDAAVTSSKLAANTIQYVQVSLNTAAVEAMYAAPVEIIPTPGANKAILIDRIWGEYVHATTSFANGGAIGLQYGATAHLAGPAASTTLAGATFDAYAASNCFDLTPDGTDTLANIANKSVTISNNTVAFGTGDGSLRVNVAYRVVSTS